MDYTRADVESLVDKLTGLDLTVEEQAVLDELVSQVEAHDEVTGYTRRTLRDVQDGTSNTIVMRTRLLSIFGIADGTSTYQGTDGADVATS